MPTEKNTVQVSNGEAESDKTPASRHRWALKFSAISIPFLLVGLFVGLTIKIGLLSIFAARQDRNILGNA